MSREIHHRVSRLGAYEDEHGNRIVVEDPATLGSPPCNVTFRGSGNKLIVKSGVALGSLTIVFEGDFGSFCLGMTPPEKAGQWKARIGSAARVQIGTHVMTESACTVVAQAHAKVVIEEEVIIAEDCEISAVSPASLCDPGVGDAEVADADVLVSRGARLEQEVLVSGGVSIGAGSLVLRRSVVRDSIRSFVVASGNPAVAEIDTVAGDES